MIGIGDIIRWILGITLLVFIWMGKTWAIASALTLILVGDELFYWMEVVRTNKATKKFLLDLMGGTRN